MSQTVTLWTMNTEVDGHLAVSVYTSLAAAEVAADHSMRATCAYFSTTPPEDFQAPDEWRDFMEDQDLPVQVYVEDHNIVL